MARRIRWQIVIAVVSTLLVVVLLGQLALATTAVSQPLTGGVYVEGVPGLPQQIVPPLNDPLSDPSGRDIAALLFDGLTRIGPDGLPAPALAESWQTDQDGSVYIFRLREDVTWHDGESFDADDVVFTIRSIQSPEFNGNPALANFWENVLVDRIDDYTVRFSLEAPYAPFPSAAMVKLLPEHVLSEVPVEEWAESSFAEQPVGTGPYLLDDLTTERAVLVANRDYFDSRPFIDRFELRFIESPQATLPLLADGELRALGASSTRAPELAQVDMPANVRRVSMPMDEYVVLTFNTREMPLSSLALRRALAHGLDKSALVEQVMDGQVVRVDNPILPGWWAFDPTIGWYGYNLETAAQTLDELGYERTESGIRERNGRLLSLPLITDSDPARLAAAREVARQWSMLGVEVEVEELDRDTLRERLQERDFMLALHGWARLGPDPDVFELWHSSQADEGLNYAGLMDETIDEVLEQGRIDQEIAARNEHYATFQRRWVELAPSITLYQPIYTFAVDEDVDGIGFEPGQIASGFILIGREDRYRHVTRWFVNSSREIRGTLR
jgi:peptide/nickel transport system substrate-binding protein